VEPHHGCLSVEVERGSFVGGKRGGGKRKFRDGGVETFRQGLSPFPQLWGRMLFTNSGWGGPQAAFSFKLDQGGNDLKPRRSEKTQAKKLEEELIPQS